MFNTQGKSLKQIQRPDSNFMFIYQFCGSDLITRAVSSSGWRGKMA